MSERDFELYLSLLSRLLQLDAAQREQIADELRDHLEERLAQLVDQGLSRDEAIGRAVEELGDAAGLAASFSVVSSRTRKRRLIMRCTLGSIGAAAAAILLAMAMWPEEARVQVPNRAVAQQPGKQPAQPGAQKSESRHAGDPQAAVNAKLDKKLQSINFVDTPLLEVLSFISDATELDILVDTTFFNDNGLTLDLPVKLQVKHASVSARTALELALEQLGASDSAGYTIRDGLVYITEKYQSHEIRVYNCRDLMNDVRAKPLDASSPPGAPGIGGPLGGENVLGGLGGGLGGVEYPIAGPQQALVAVITATIHPDTWDIAGGSGSVAEFNGLLIVKHSQTVQREIQQLLDLMRHASAEKQ